MTKTKKRVDLPKLLANETIKFRANNEDITMTWRELQKLLDAGYMLGFNACDCGR